MKLTKNLAIIVSSSWTRYTQLKILVCKDLLAFARILIGLSSPLSANAVIECRLNDLPGGNSDKFLQEQAILTISILNPDQ